jgi:hypothetical protein
VREIRDEIERRVRELVEERADEIRADRSDHQRRLAQLLPSLADEFGDVPVRSFVLTLAQRRVRECLSEPECAVLASR